MGMVKMKPPSRKGGNEPKQPDNLAPTRRRRSSVFGAIDQIFVRKENGKMSNEDSTISRNFKLLASATDREAKVKKKEQTGMRKVQTAEVLAAEIYRGHRDAVWRELARMSRKDIRKLQGKDEAPTEGCSQQSFMTFMDETAWDQRKHEGADGKRLTMAQKAGGGTAFVVTSKERVLVPMLNKPKILTDNMPGSYQYHREHSPRERRRIQRVEQGVRHRYCAFSFYSYPQRKEEHTSRLWKLTNPLSPFSVLL
jgi:hypothetical protein